MTDVLGLGVVGLGFLGRRYARFLNGVEGVRLAGVYDLDDDLAREVAAECGLECSAAGQLDTGLESMF